MYLAIWNPLMTSQFIPSPAIRQKDCRCWDPGEAWEVSLEDAGNWCPVVLEKRPYFFLELAEKEASWDLDPFPYAENKESGLRKILPTSSPFKGNKTQKMHWILNEHEKLPEYSELN